MMRASLLVGGLLSLAVRVAMAAEATGFPVDIPVGICGTILVVDLDGDGTVEVATTVSDAMVVVQRDGKMRPGFPAALRRGNNLQAITLAGPTACDLDGDGKQDLAVTGSDRRLYAVNSRGEPLVGYPVELSGVARGLPTCAPPSSGAAQRLLLATDVGELVSVAGSKPKVRSLGRIGAGAEGGVAVADLDGDKVLDFVVVGGDGVLHVQDDRGRALKASGYRMGFRASGTPAVGDVNDDGRLEIVVGSQDFKVHVINSDGASPKGFPTSAGYRIYPGAALGDLDGDDVADIVVASGDGKLFAFTGGGQSIPGFPITLEGRIVADPVIGDVDKDGRADVVVLTQAGALYVVDASGRNLSGSPQKLGSKGGGAPALSDLDGDGLFEIVAATADGSLHAVKLGNANKAERALAAWPSAGHDARRLGRLTPADGRFKDLSYRNLTPRTDDVIDAQYRFFDVDGDAESGTQIRWYRDGTRVSELDNQRKVKKELTKKHERWHFTVQSGDNHRAYGESGVLSRVFVAPDITVGDTPPQKPGITLSPVTPNTKAWVEAKVARAAIDADGDALTYLYRWRKDGTPQSFPVTQANVDPAATHKGERWDVQVVPFDGELEGEPAVAQVTIVNTPPGAASVALDPVSPGIEDDVRVVVTPAADDDGDVLHYTYEYRVDNQLVNLPATSNVVPARTLRKHQRLHVEVTAWDDEVAGGKSGVDVETRNSVPPKPRIVIVPAAPLTKQDIRFGIVESEADADRDAVRFKVRWLRNGVAVDTGDVVPASRTRKHEQWRVEVTPNDGEHDGSTVSAQVRIENTPPQPPLVALDRYELYAGDVVSPRIIVAAADDDGDPVTLKYTWRVNGKAQAWPPAKAELLAREIHRDEAWDVEITPHDGETDGRSVHLSFQVRNTAPTPPAVALDKSEATVRDRVYVRISKPAEDRDGDKLSYVYRWYRNGKVVSDWPVSKAALEPLQAKKGDLLRVEVRASDGTLESTPVFVDLRMINQSPTPPVAVVRPTTPKAGDTLTCVADKAAVDADGDSLAYEAIWFVDGVFVPLATDRQASLPSLTRKGQAWACELAASDGVAVSVSARSAAVSIANSAPVAPQVAISPTTPRAGDDLICGVGKPASDLDLDRITYRYEWRRNGKAWSRPSSLGKATERIPASVVRRDDEWECVVTANDGAVDAPTATARTRVANTAPTAPGAILKPEQPPVSTKLVCEVTTPATDADGDKPRYLYTWFKNGIPQGFAPTSMEVPPRLVQTGDHWRCSVAATDGHDTGKATSTAEVTVIASPASPAAK